MAMEAKISPVKDLEATIEEVMEHLRSELTERLVAHAERGLAVGSHLGSSQAIARAMVEALPEPPSGWNRWLGPFYRTRQLADRLEISRQALADRRRRGTLLALKTSDGHLVYPAFQFRADGSVLEGLPEVLQTLRASGVDDWTLAGWLATPQDSLEEQSCVEWLRAGGDSERALALARDAAAGFSQ